MFIFTYFTLQPGTWTMSFRLIKKGNKRVPLHLHKVCPCFLKARGGEGLCVVSLLDVAASITVCSSLEPHALVRSTCLLGAGLVHKILCIFFFLRPAWALLSEVGLSLVGLPREPKGQGQAFVLLPVHRRSKLYDRPPAPGRCAALLGCEPRRLGRYYTCHAHEFDSIHENFLCTSIKVGTLDLRPKSDSWTAKE
jgi:hypothetical protein